MTLMFSSACYCCAPFESTSDAYDETHRLGAPDPEVAAIAKRRQFSSSERHRILAAADRCSKAGEIGALLRREGIYSSQLAAWRKRRVATEHAALAPQKRGRKADPALAQARRVAEL